MKRIINLPLYRRINGQWHQAELHLDTEGLYPLAKSFFEGLFPILIIPVIAALVVGLLDLVARFFNRIAHRQ